MRIKAEEILKNKLDPKILIINNPDYTFNKVIEAMIEFANLNQESMITLSEAFEFNKWCSDKGWIYYESDNEWVLAESMDNNRRHIFKTDSELYQLFKETKDNVKDGSI